MLNQTAVGKGLNVSLGCLKAISWRKGLSQHFKSVLGVVQEPGEHVQFRLFVDDLFSCDRKQEGQVREEEPLVWLCAVPRPSMISKDPSFGPKR